jgi:hypothetical protein
MVKTQNHILLIALLSFAAMQFTLPGYGGTPEAKKLSSDSFERAATFVRATARPLDRALFAYHFENGSRDAVLAELAKYQNSDGGFQSLLESDTRWTGSSGLGAMKALRVFNEVNAPPSDPHMQLLVKYLLATFDEKAGQWHALPIAANAAPHAAWWEVKEDLGRSVVESTVFPTAAIAGYLRAYGTLLPQGFLDRVTASCLKYLEAAPIKMAMPDVESLSALVDYLPPSDRASAVKKLKAVLAEETVTDPQKWNDYSIRPLTFVQSPKSPLFAGSSAAVDANLDYIIATQKPDGGWAAHTVERFTQRFAPHGAHRSGRVQ